jgi:hypothetical protein
MVYESSASFIERYRTKLTEAKMDGFVTVELSSAQDGVVSLDTIKSHRLGKGYAKTALAYLILQADEFEYEITLIPHPLDETTDKERLLKWYTALGFVVENDGEVMRRGRAKKNPSN